MGRDRGRATRRRTRRLRAMHARASRPLPCPWPQWARTTAPVECTAMRRPLPGSRRVRFPWALLVHAGDPGASPLLAGDDESEDVLPVGHGPDSDGQAMEEQGTVLPEVAVGGAPR